MKPIDPTQFKIFPRNLTARAGTIIAGNPPTSRPESGVANCFPGLEFDHRNLDRRFFPGLVFDFNDGGPRNGGVLVDVAPDDPDLARPPRAFAAQARILARDFATGSRIGGRLRAGLWFIEVVAQAGRRIKVGSLGGDNVWRLIQCLEPGEVRITLARREKRSKGKSITLNGWRRDFTDRDSGVISLAYQPGELTQSMCSPWQHDFRDCSCNYWASNHPDIVLGPIDPGSKLSAAATPTAPGGDARIDWLRADRSPAGRVPAQGNFDLNRPRQLDHFEINERWQELAFVLRGREIDQLYAPPSAQYATPFANAIELEDELKKLAGLEHVLALEYLYALSSIPQKPVKAADAKKWPTLADDLTFVRHELLTVAVSEMRHLRWVNQILWSLRHKGLIADDHSAALDRATLVPDGHGTHRPARLCPLTPAVLESFIAVEEPSGTLEGEYARVASTLRRPEYLPDLFEIAEHIVADGVEHYGRFRQIRLTLKKYVAKNAAPYIRAIAPARASDPQAKAARLIYNQILDELRRVYAMGDMEEGGMIAQARAAMFELLGLMDTMAATGKGVPFFLSGPCPL